MMTQEDYNLWTGDTIALDDGDWNRLVMVASKRLASFLCLPKLSMCPDVMTDELQMLLANFICSIWKFRGSKDGKIASKTVQSFTISYDNSTAADAFAQVAANYADTVEKYSACDIGIDVESSPYERF